MPEVIEGHRHVLVEVSVHPHGYQRLRAVFLCNAYWESLTASYSRSKESPLRCLHPKRGLWTFALACVSINANKVILTAFKFAFGFFFALTWAKKQCSMRVYDRSQGLKYGGELIW